MTEIPMPLPAMAQTPTSVPPAVLLANHLKALKLPTFVREYEKVAFEAAQDRADYPRYLLRLCELERIDRERRMVERRIRMARFPHTKSFDTFDFAAQPSLNKALVLELARGEWIEQRRNVIALGPSGTGKTHAALALGLAACQKGQSVAFTTAAALVHDLKFLRSWQGRCSFARLRALASQLQPPLPQPCNPLAVALIEKLRRHHTVGAEAAEISAQFAPSDEDAHGFQIADPDRPDCPLAWRVLLVAIVEAHLAACVDPFAGPRDIEAVGRGLRTRLGRGCRLQHKGAQIVRNGTGDLGDKIACRLRQHRIAAPRHPLRAQHRRLDLVTGKHQRRHVEIGAKHIAETGFAPDRHALADQVRDVAIDGADRHFEFAADRPRGQRPARAAQDLDDLEQAVGAAHITSRTKKSKAS